MLEPVKVFRTSSATDYGKTLHTLKNIKCSDKTKKHGFSSTGGTRRAEGSIDRTVVQFANWFSRWRQWRSISAPRRLVVGEALDYFIAVGRLKREIISMTVRFAGRASVFGAMAPTDFDWFSDAYDLQKSSQNAPTWKPKRYIERKKENLGGLAILLVTVHFAHSKAVLLFGKIDKGTSQRPQSRS